MESAAGRVVVVACSTRRQAYHTSRLQNDRPLLGVATFCGCDISTLDVALIELAGAPGVSLAQRHTAPSLRSLCGRCARGYAVVSDRFSRFGPPARARGPRDAGAWPGGAGNRAYLAGLATWSGGSTASDGRSRRPLSRVGRDAASDAPSGARRTDGLQWLSRRSVTGPRRDGRRAVVRPAPRSPEARLVLPRVPPTPARWGRRPSDTLSGPSSLGPSSAGPGSVVPGAEWPAVRLARCRSTAPRSGARPVRRRLDGPALRPLLSGGRLAPSAGPPPSARLVRRPLAPGGSPFDASGRGVRSLVPRPGRGSREAPACPSAAS